MLTSTPAYKLPRKAPYLYRRQPSTYIPDDAQGDRGWLENASPPHRDGCRRTAPRSSWRSRPLIERSATSENLQKANFSELRQGEVVRRIHLPRTPVNKPHSSGRINQDPKGRTLRAGNARKKECSLPISRALS